MPMMIWNLALTPFSPALPYIHECPHLSELLTPGSCTSMTIIYKFKFFNRETRKNHHCIKYKGYSSNATIAHSASQRTLPMHLLSTSTASPRLDPKPHSPTTVSHTVICTYMPVPAAMLVNGAASVCKRCAFLGSIIKQTNISKPFVSPTQQMSKLQTHSFTGSNVAQACAT
jgi:hypothetical protein